MDGVKTAIASLTGAGIAFSFALYRDHLLQRRDRIAAGNMAVITLMRQTNHYLAAAAMIREHRDWLLSQQPTSPLWMHIKPMHFDYSDALRFKMDSLVFLLERSEGAAIIQALLSVEMHYHDLFGMLKVHATISEALQLKLSDANIDMRQRVPVTDLERVAGFQIIAKANSFVHGIFECIDRDEAAFREACDQLPRALRGMFGRKAVIGIAVPDTATFRAEAVQSVRGSVAAVAGAAPTTSSNRWDA